MPIFINGNEYQDEAHMEAALSPMLKGMGVDVPPVQDKRGEVKPPAGDEKMVQTPNDMMTNQQLNQDSITDDILGGTEISYQQPRLYVSPARPPEASTEPAGALNSTEGTQTAPTEEDLSQAFLQRLTGTPNPKPAGEIVKNWVTEKLTGIYEALKLPGDAWQGKIDPTTPEGIERTNKLAGLMVMGPAPLAAKMADGTLGSFAGVRSKTYDKPSLELAQQAKKDGYSPEEIHKSTGWFQGADQRWRYEIDDSQMGWVPPRLSEKGPLDRFLDHPELFKAYPALRKVEVINDPYYASKGAEFHSLGGDKAIIRMGSDAAQNPGTLMHEVQHAIQELEQTAKGGSAAKPQDYKLRYEDDINKLRPKILDFNKRVREGDTLTPQEEAQYDYLKVIFNHYNKYSSEGRMQARMNYMALAGEAEARNVDTRLLLSQEERMKSYPKDTQDIADQHQLVSDVPVLTTPYTHKETQYKPYHHD